MYCNSSPAERLCSRGPENVWHRELRRIAGIWAEQFDLHRRTPSGRSLDSQARQAKVRIDAANFDRLLAIFRHFDARPVGFDDLHLRGQIGQDFDLVQDRLLAFFEPLVVEADLIRRMPGRLSIGLEQQRDRAAGPIAIGSQRDGLWHGLTRGRIELDPGGFDRLVGDGVDRDLSFLRGP